MPDMLVKLYELPDLIPHIARQREAGVEIRRALVPERHVVVAWVREHFGEGWGSEAAVSFSYHPVACFIAVENKTLLGFACYDTSARDFFGPIGVREDQRGRGVGAALFLACLHDMRAQGYAYAIVGAAGPTEFYTRLAGAVAIEGSSPGIYRGMLALPEEWSPE